MMITSVRVYVALLTGGFSALLIQQNVDGSNFFNRTWAAFKVGFGNTSDNYWLGNDQLYQLTNTGKYKLRFDLQSLDNGQWYWAEYTTFIVTSESNNYTLTVGGFTGNVYSDAFGYHNGSQFTTKDRDNDDLGGNCALHNGGGFWNHKCGQASVTARRGVGDGFSWYFLTDNPSYYQLQTSRMWLMCSGEHAYVKS